MEKINKWNRKKKEKDKYVGREMNEVDEQRKKNCQ